MRFLNRVSAMVAATLFAAAGALNVAVAQDRQNTPSLEGRIVAVGIPGASAITPVGTFLPGSPIGNPANPLHAFTAPGRVLDPTRILVGSNSNFGAALGNASEREGTFLSIDPNGDMLVIPSDFASAGGQVSISGGRVQVYSANNAAFMNGIKNPNAHTKDIPGVSNPLGISINNAFGRLWPANAPNGLDGLGTSSILDPQGWGLAGAPNPLIGGEYTGTVTNRSAVTALPQVTPGALNTGAVGTAFLGGSPDGATPVRAVFVVVGADGTLVQEHTAKGLDGLDAPAGSIDSIIGRPDEFNGDDKVGVTPRFGVVFAWEPNLILFVSEPFQNTIAVLDITADPPGVNSVFHASNPRHFSAKELNHPVDLAPVTMETTDPHFASNTTLDSDSDFYVANRGDNTIVRMSQTGQVIAVRRVTRADGMPLGDARLNGIATSPDGSKIWVTVTGRLPGISNSVHSTGAVLELPSF